MARELGWFQPCFRAGHFRIAHSGRDGVGFNGMNRNDSSKAKSGGERTRGIRTAGWQVVLALLVMGAGLGTTFWVAHSQELQESLRRQEEFQQSSDKLFSRTLRAFGTKVLWKLRQSNKVAVRGSVWL